LLQAEYRDLAEEYVKAMKEHFGSRLVSICFFGSVARCEASAESDLDVLVVAEGLPRGMGWRIHEMIPLDLAIRATKAYRALRSAGRSAFVSDLYLTPEEVKAHPPILLDIADHGVIAYDRDGFLGKVLDDVRRRLRELGARRVVAKNGYYWVLKPDARPTDVVEV